MTTLPENYDPLSRFPEEFYFSIRRSYRPNQQVGEVIITLAETWDKEERWDDSAEAEFPPWLVKELGLVRKLGDPCVHYFHIHDATLKRLLTDQGLREKEDLTLSQVWARDL